MQPWGALPRPSRMTSTREETVVRRALAGLLFVAALLIAFLLATAGNGATAVCAHPQSPWYEVRGGVTYVCTTSGPVAQDRS